MPSSRISIKVDSYNDKTRGKLNRRANKNRNRARHRNPHQSKFNKPGHREQGSYKPRPPSPPRQTRSYHTLTVELKKIEDAFIRSWEDYYEEMEIEIAIREEEARRKKFDEEDERSYEPPVKQPVEPVEIQDPRYIGEENHDELSWSTWEGDDSWEQACRERRQMEAYDRQVEQEWEGVEREEEVERNFQFKDGVFW